LPYEWSFHLINDGLRVVCKPGVDVVRHLARDTLGEDSPNIDRSLHHIDRDVKEVEKGRKERKSSGVHYSLGQRTLGLYI
jgi:hypothetical protein